MGAMNEPTPPAEPADAQSALEAADPADAPQIAEELAQNLQDDLDRVAGTETDD